MVTLEGLLPTPPADYGAFLQFMVAFSAILLACIGFAARKYLSDRDKRDAEAAAYRDKRDADEKAFRDKQLEIQQQHYKDVSDERDKFRATYQANTNERLDGFEHSIKDGFAEIRSILAQQQEQITGVDKEFHGLKTLFFSQNGQQHPPKEGGK